MVFQLNKSKKYLEYSSFIFNSYEETIIPGVRTFSKDGTWKVLLGNGMQEGWSAGIEGRSPIPIKHAQGWVKEADGFWRYGNPDGSAKTGWFEDKGAWYYSYASLDGGMAINTYVGSYKVDSSGALIENAVVPKTEQGKFGTEYLGENLGYVYFNSTFQNAYMVPIRIIDDLLTQGKIVRGNFHNSNAGDVSDWYLKQ